MITELLHIDNGFDDLPSKDRLKQRQLVLTDKVDAYTPRWLIKAKPARHSTTALTRNNICGGSLRMAIFPWIITLPSKLFDLILSYAKTVSWLIQTMGAKASAMLYSLVETAKANNLIPYKYFELLLTAIPQHMDDKSQNFLNSLLPWASLVQEQSHSQNKKS